MADSPRDELATLARMIAVHVEWQRELGADGFERSTRGPIALARDANEPSALRTAPVSEPARPTPARPATAPPPDDAPRSPLRVERPDFMRRHASTPAPPLAAPLPAAQPIAAQPPAAQPMATPPIAAQPPAAQPMATPPIATPAPSVAPPVTPPAMTAPTRVTASDAAPDAPARLRTLEVLRNEVAACTRCRLHEKRTQTVFARGNPFASLMFVGEGPGRDEDLQGEPFVGAAGQLLDKIIGAMGLTANDVYITNVVRCRPPNNRVPQPDEMAACGSYLAAQIDAVKPRVLVALGKTAASYLLGTSDAMARLRNTWHEWRGTPLLVTWHPAYLLRTPEAKKDTWDDMKRVLAKLELPVPPARRGGAD